MRGAPASELEKMRAGLPYQPGDPGLVAMRKRAQRLMHEYNQTVYGDDAERARLLSALFGYPTDVVIRPPFHVDYGTEIRLGSGVFFNYGCVVLDVGRVTIGDRVQIGPYVQVLTADHPRNAAKRALGAEWGRAITIGADAWVGGGAILLPGVNIGEGAIVAAGAVVTRDVPAHTTAGGNPARALSKTR